ncbi:tetratricopeptide repeat protein [Rhizobium sp. KAs_5_22]|nr:tetratricopeptide repeat protein [Rhizobium sp. KAs_5_22]
MLRAGMADKSDFEHLNDLPKRDTNNEIERRAQRVFRSFVDDSESFFIQTPDTKDFGTDYQLEALENGSATNVRVHVQLKGTTKNANSDGSITIGVERSNLNYLMVQRYSFYVCYHLPSDRLLFAPVDSVITGYSHSGKSWTEQDTISVRFSKVLDHEALNSIASLARLQSNASRDYRFSLTASRAEDLGKIVGSGLPEIHVPEDQSRAAALLEGLYYNNKEEIISAAIHRFEAVLGSNHDAMRFCCMAEINLGMSGHEDAKRISCAIDFFNRLIDTGRFEKGGLHFTIGNGQTALRDEEAAISSYVKALGHLDTVDDRELVAQCLKNMGSSYFKLGERDKAARHFEDALKLAPTLAEAHHALGVHYVQQGIYEKALDHFDNVVFDDGRISKSSSTLGWRINCYFNLRQNKAAFREINSLLAHAGTQDWIWPWTARQVASFGLTSIESAQPSLDFWHRFRKVHPDNDFAYSQLLLAQVYLKMNGVDIGVEYNRFRRDFEPLIATADASQAPFLWDRLGHFAQIDGQWDEAARCFHHAYDLGGVEYGYCLGTALNFLNRGVEAISILKEQAERVQPDAMSWFQLAVAYEQAGQDDGAISSYQKAIALDPEYDLAWFNLGGVFWNAGAAKAARKTWRTAVEKFPDHELAIKLQSEPGFLRD